MEPHWLVLLCQSCNRAFGKPKSAKDRQCPHCNHNEAKILSRHMSANDASDAVSLANVPSEIRDQLATWLEKEKTNETKQEVLPTDGPNVLSLATGIDGSVTLESIQKALKSLNSSMDAEHFAEQACAEGELLQVGINCWKRA